MSAYFNKLINTNVSFPSGVVPLVLSMMVGKLGFTEDNYSSFWDSWRALCGAQQHYAFRQNYKMRNLLHSAPISDRFQM